MLLKCNYSVSRLFFSTVRADVRWSFACNMRITREGRGRRARAVQHVPAHVPSSTDGLSMTSSESCVHVCVCQSVSLCQYCFVFLLCFCDGTFLLTRDDEQIYLPILIDLFNCTLAYFSFSSLVHVYALINQLILYFAREAATSPFIVIN